MPNYHSSEWHRWDPHIHAPGTALEDGFLNNWEAYFASLEQATPSVTVLGITDYLSIRTYEEFLARKPLYHTPELAFVFPNIEFRLAPKTTKGNAINAHLLVSPDEKDHIRRINEALSRLTISAKEEVIACTEGGLITLGRIHSSAPTDDEAAFRVGVAQFKVDVSAFLHWLENEHWLRSNSLLGIAGGNDGLAGLRRDSGFRQYHDTLVSAADFIFSGQPSDREYYAGRGDTDSAGIEARYRSLKPCLHGSDAHEQTRVLVPDLNRYCWIKAAPTFDGLRQVLFEPWDRIHIGSQPPPSPDADQIIRSIRIADHNGWFATEELLLGRSLVAIIGEKGSGKTALADVIAMATNAWEETEASFLAKAWDHLATVKVQLTWESGRTSSASLESIGAVDQPAEVRYLSQQFVERLCSADLLADELVREVERVVFEHIPPQARLNSICFADLVRKTTEAITTERTEIRQSLSELNDMIDIGNVRKAALAKQRETLAGYDKDIARLEAHLKSLLSARDSAASATIKALRDKRDGLAATAARIREQLSKTDHVHATVLRTEARFTEWYEGLRADLILSGVPHESWPEFKPTFTGKPLEPLARHRARLEKQHTVIIGTQDDPDNAETLTSITRRLAAEEKKLELDDTRRRQVVKQQNALAEIQGKKKQLADDISEVERWEREDRPQLRERRDAIYARYFELFLEEKRALASLYEPLRADLAERSTGERDLDFEVVTTVNIDDWAALGEDMLDLRRSGKYTQRGALEKEARQLLEKPWLDGDAAAIREGLRTIGEGIVAGGGLKQMLRQGYTAKHVADWLYSVDHIKLEYGLRYKNVALRFLSPGTRGIVLLILYLAIDTSDDRPLLVDQPEENLDNASVFSVLVQYFREAKRRRQIILVTHNPNLVVNTDAEQIIVASAERRDSGLPRITYSSGPLEHVSHIVTSSPLKERVCEILEGGRSAFRNRMRRYG
jgi:ABC-type lipoprotein export system ATPase subunit